MEAKTVLKSNNTVLCQDINLDERSYARLHILQLSEVPMNIIFSKDFIKHN